MAGLAAFQDERLYCVYQARWGWEEKFNPYVAIMLTAALVESGAFRQDRLSNLDDTVYIEGGPFFPLKYVLVLASSTAI